MILNTYTFLVFHINTTYLLGEKYLVSVFLLLFILGFTGLFPFNFIISFLYDNIRFIPFGFLILIINLLMAIAISYNLSIIILSLLGNLFAIINSIIIMLLPEHPLTKFEKLLYEFFLNHKIYIEKSIYIFILGYLIRYFIYHGVNIDIYKEYNSFISIIYYYLYAYFSVYVYNSPIFEKGILDTINIKDFFNSINEWSKNWPNYIKYIKSGFYMPMEGTELSNQMDKKNSFDKIISKPSVLHADAESSSAANKRGTATGTASNNNTSSNTNNNTSTSTPTLSAEKIKELNREMELCGRRMQMEDEMHLSTMDAQDRASGQEKQEFARKCYQHHKEANRHWKEAARIKRALGKHYVHKPWFDSDVDTDIDKD